MWSITLRDLQFRRRRFIIAIGGTSLVFAMALALAGMSQGFRDEVEHTVSSVGADAWIVRAGAAGPFTAFSTVPEELATQLEQDGGVGRADPLVFVRQAFHRRGRVADANLFGYRPGGLGTPPVARGRAPRSGGEAVVDDRLSFGIGESFTIAGRPFRVVGVTTGLTLFTGISNIYVPLADAQAVAFQGQPVATMVVTRGTPNAAPPGFVVMSNEQARADLLRPVANGIRTIDTTQILLWVVATFIVGAGVYLSALERVRDFAVLKTVGASSRQLFVGLAAQSLVVALIAAALATGLALLIGPQFALPVRIPARAFLLSIGVAVVVGLAASLFGLRRAIAVDPALAFGGP